MNVEDDVAQKWGFFVRIMQEIEGVDMGKSGRAHVD